MAVVGGSDLHRGQLTFDYLDQDTGEVTTGRIVPADRDHLRAWLERFADEQQVAFALEGCTGWRYVVEELQRAGSPRTWPSPPRPPACAAANAAPPPTVPTPATCGQSGPIFTRVPRPRRDTWTNPKSTVSRQAAAPGAAQRSRAEQGWGPDVHSVTLRGVHQATQQYELSWIEVGVRTPPSFPWSSQGDEGACGGQRPTHRLLI
jgi:hypothetical protein